MAGGQADGRAHLCDRLGRRRLDDRGFDRVRAAPPSRRLRLDRYVERRHFARTEDPARAGLSGAARTRDSPRDIDTDDGTGPHY